MSPVPRLARSTNVSEREPVESGLSSDGGSSGVDREEDEPRDDPDGEEDLDHHAKVSKEDVGVGSVLVEDVLWI